MPSSAPASFRNAGPGETLGLRPLESFGEPLQRLLERFVAIRTHGGVPSLAELVRSAVRVPTGRWDPWDRSEGGLLGETARHADCPRRAGCGCSLARTRPKRPAELDGRLRQGSG